MTRQCEQIVPDPGQCPVTISDTVCVQADITIVPDVVVGNIQAFCEGSATIGPCDGSLADECSFSVRQMICVQIPLTFSAVATASQAGVVCGTPGKGSCGCPV